MERAQQRLRAGIRRASPAITTWRGSARCRLVCRQHLRQRHRRHGQQAGAKAASSALGGLGGNPSRSVMRARRSRFIAATELPEGSAPS